MTLSGSIESGGESRRWRNALLHAGCVLFIAAVSVFLFSDLLQSKVFWSHENLFPYIRAEQVANELRQGHYPQAFPDALNGAGYAFPRFYPPFSLFLSAFLTIAFGDSCLGVNIAYLLSVVASGAAMYFMAIVVAGDRRTAVATSLLYVSLPYRFVDIYVRGALAESWTFALYPIIVAGVWKALTRRELPWYLPVSIGALLITHNITAIYFLGFVAVLCAIAWWKNGWKGAALPVLAVVLGFGVAFWFLLPQQYYIKSVWVGDGSFMWADVSHVQDHRVEWNQLFYSDSQHWLGESYKPPARDGMSFELGIGQLLAVAVFAFFLRTRRLRRDLDPDPSAIALAVAAAAGWVVSILFMVYPAVFLRMLPTQFAYVQFPWRMLGLAGFLSMLALSTFWQSTKPGARASTMLVGVALATVLLVPGFEKRMNDDPEFRHAEVSAPEYVQSQARHGFTVLGEYYPRDFNVAMLGDDDVDLSFLDGPRIASGANAEVREWRKNGLEADMVVTTNSEAAIVLPIVYYDFYSATTRDGHAFATSSTEGFLTVRVPEGEHRISIRQHVTPVIWVGIVGTCASLAAVFVFDLMIRRRRRSAVAGQPEAPQPGPRAFSPEPETDALPGELTTLSGIENATDA